jgi:hypothetical protein
MKEYKLIDCLPSTLSNQFDFVVNYDDESYTVFDTNFFITEIYEHFSDRQIRLADTLPDVALKGLFDMWAESRNDNYARRMYALSIDYNPLENYDRMEDQEHSDETTHGETITRTLANNDTESYTNYKETNKRTGSVENTSEVYGANSANSVPSDVSTDTYNNLQDEKSYTGSKTDAHTGTITDGHSGSTGTSGEYTLRAHGNIGTTTSAQMLAEDLGFLGKDIALIALCEFIDRYTYLAEGIDL